MCKRGTTALWPPNTPSDGLGGCWGAGGARGVRVRFAVALAAVAMSVLLLTGCWPLPESCSATDPVAAAAPAPEDDVPEVATMEPDDNRLCARNT